MLSYLWQFGDGATAAGATPGHTYATGGTFTVTLTVTDPGGLAHTAATQAIVNRTPTAADGGPYAGNAGQPVAFDGALGTALFVAAVLALVGGVVVSLAYRDMARRR